MHKTQGWGTRLYVLDENKFALLNKGSTVVSCIVYRGTKRYYVEVGVLNQGAEPLTIQRDFVAFDKPGYTVLKTSPLHSAGDVAASVAGPFISSPPPPATSARTTYEGSASTYGNTTYLSGTATTRVDNSAAGWHALGVAIAARSYYKSQAREETFATYLVSFNYENQPLTIEPGKAQIYVHTFEQLKQKKAPFRIHVVVGQEDFTFNYKE